MVNNGSKAGVSTAPPHELNVWKFVENKRRRTTGHDNRVAKKKLRKRRRVGVGEKGETDLVREDEKKVPRCVQRNIELKKNPPSGFGTSGDGTKRLRTHVWHAKRFTMKKLWGFYVPLGLHGRGRGSRALLKKLKHGVLAHDASYYGPVQLEGPEASISDTLMSVLSSVLVPSPSACCEETLHDILAGATFGTAMLHHAGKPCFSPIAPVTYMWRPLQQISTNEERLSTDVSDGERNIDDGIIIRQLWIWIHAAACEEAYDSLSSVCERQVDTTRSAHCFSRGGQLAKLELVGSKVFELLQKTLIPTSCNFDKSWHLKKCSGDEHDDPVEPEKTSIFENGHQISSTAVVSMVVKDPRALTKKGNVIVPEEKPHGLLSNEEFQIKEQISSSLPKNVAEGVHQYGDLWDASKGVLPPVEESVLFKAFWIIFMSNGAHAIGLREKHWVACEIGLPYFPFDFPDCNAYSNFMAMEAVEINQKERLRPPSKRPLEVPIPPPWDCVHLTLGKRSSKAGNSHSQVEEISAQNEKNDDMEKKSAFEGIIARTSCILSDYLNNTNGSHFLLFPRKSDQKDNLCKFMRDEEFLKQDTVISEVKCGKTLYYLRVLLRACKEGVFEQGAVVCAPLPSDIMLLKSSSESDDQRLQIPQSSLKSYFTQLPSGKWELQIPEDKAVHESYSKKATAGALCEASLLSMLRAEQWKTLPVRQRKKEIYVLVRNMRSTAYRLALATIVLEQQEEDVQFM
ncbi:hypothetical protein DH2020_021054 [Rehmannia glutinosa]|uniref:Uncharacterized protein n=1 Tax=Rehmannia glutinosa TaxID=99300 RepID=A0ABR0WAZ0_REHGL